MKLIIGIDEAGRGPIAGPVTVGAFGSEAKTAEWILRNIFENKLRDSKKLSEKKREAIFGELEKMRVKGLVDFSVAHSTPKYIDRFGITKAIKRCVALSLQKLYHTKKYEGYPLPVRLDGSLKAPKEYKNQKTIIKGDEKNIHIACASIVAKVTRDRLMCRFAKKYPEYGFDIHKGYGTKAHVSKIKKLGLSDLHRSSFCGLFK